MISTLFKLFIDIVQRVRRVCIHTIYIISCPERQCLKVWESSQAGPQFRVVPVELVFLPLMKAFVLGKYLFVVEIVLSTHSDVLNIFPWALRF